MAIKFFGWGRWGKAVICHPGNTSGDFTLPASIIDEEQTSCQHFPDPVSAEAFFTTYFAQWCRDFESPDPLCRIHFLNMGENFASGALSIFLKKRRKKGKNTDIVIGYLPPFGTNSSNVGRFLANCLGNQDFADLFLCLESSAPIFRDGDEWNAVNYAAPFTRLFQGMERSCCMIPLLRSLDSRVLTSAFAENSVLNSECSLESLWRAASTEAIDYSQIPVRAKKILVFSLADLPDFNLADLVRRNLDTEKCLYIPFMRCYEWNRSLLPSPTGRADAKKFTGAFIANIAPISAKKFLDEYFSAYWPDDNCDNLEKLDPVTWDWMRKKKLKPPAFSLQDVSLLKEALKFYRKLAIQSFEH